LNGFARRLWCNLAAKNHCKPVDSEDHLTE